MQDSEWLRILEPALHAQLASRCHRAYRHDLRNGLQGIYGGFDALSRLLQLARDPAKVERTTDFVRQAIAGHEKSLEKVLHGLAPLEPTPEVADVSLVLHELIKFLTNDAAANRVSLRYATVQPVAARIRSDRLRLALLGLMIDAIEAMSSGGTLQLSCTASNDASLLELSDTRAAALPENPWDLDLTATPSYRGWTPYVVRHLIVGEGGHIDCDALPTGGRRIRISLAAARCG